VFQRSLFDTATEPCLRPLDSAVRRIPLSDGAWIDHLPGWVERAELLFEDLVGQVAWRSEERKMYDRTVDVPRLMASYGDDVPAPHPLLDEAKSILTSHYRGLPGADLATIGLCLYRDGGDSVAWHGDTISDDRAQDAVVAIMSLGWRRRLALRPKRGGSRSVHFELGEGDLLVMGGSCQRTWEHSVPKTTRRVGPRVSVQFRPLGAR